MAAPTYLQRVQKVLSDLAKDQQTTVSLDTFMSHFASPSTQDGEIAPQVCRRVQRALRHEIFAHRVRKHREDNDVVISLTNRGVTFFRSWGEITLYDPEDPHLRRMTVAEINHQCSVLRRIVHDICDTFLEHKPNLAVRADISKLPTFVSELIDNVQHFENDNIGLQIQRDEEEKERRRLRSQFRALSRDRE